MSAKLIPVFLHPSNIFHLLSELTPCIFLFHCLSICHYSSKSKSVLLPAQLIYSALLLLFQMCFPLHLSSSKIQSGTFPYILRKNLFFLKYKDYQIKSYLFQFQKNSGAYSYLRFFQSVAVL